MVDIFAIDETPRAIKYEDGRVVLNEVTLPKYYLRSLECVNDRGEIVNKVKEGYYIGHFQHQLRRANTYEVDDFLNVHYHASKDKLKYIQVVRYVAIEFFSDRPAKKQFITEWLENIISKNTKSSAQGFQEEETLTQETSFEDFLTQEGKEIYPLLLTEYKDAKPQKIFYMLCALSDFGVIHKNYYQNKTLLNEALKSSFGKIGDRQAYDRYFNNIDRFGKLITEEAKIAIQKRVITDLIEKHSSC